ncbi:MAG: tetratricopeptide repeat protein [Spirochaetia bacterium]
MKKISILFLCALVCTVQITAQEQRLFREAERRFENGDYQFALSRYKQLMEEYPDSEYIPDAKFREAVIYASLARYRASLDQLQRVAQRYSSTRYFRYIPFWQGYNLYYLQEYSSAKAEFTEFLQAEPKNLTRDALYYKALCERSLDENEQALDSVKRLYGLYDSPVQNPQMVILFTSLLVETERYEELYGLYQELDLELFDKAIQQKLSLYKSEALFQQENYSQAEPLYRQLLTASEELKTVAFKRLYVLYDKTGQDDLQQDVFDQAQTELSGNPELLAEFLLRAGIEHYQSGSYDLARSYLRRIWRTLPKERINGLVPLYLSHIMEHEGELEQAVQLLRGFLDASSDRREELLLALGRLESAREQWNNAAGVLESYLAEYPESEYLAQGNYLYAYVLYRLENYRAALAVVQDSFAKGQSGSYDRELLRLRAMLHTELGQYETAVDDLQEYVPRYPQDMEARADLGKLYFQLERYRQLHSLTEELSTEAQGAPVLELRYIDSLAYLKQGEYAQASQSLNQLEAEQLRASGLEDIIPGFYFFSGWSEYKQIDYSQALEWFRELVEEYPEHEKAVQAQYLAGWAAYADGDFMQAQEFFGKYSRQDIAAARQERGLFMYAKSSSALGKYQDAMMVYQTLYKEHPDSGFADDAMYEYASLLHVQGRSMDAVQTYERLADRYSTSPLCEEALYRRGDILYQLDEYEQARDAYYDHRSRFPEGSLVDVSLYWGGMAALRADEPYGALLLWEKLVEEHEDSSFYADTLLELARLHTDLGEYQSAVSYYTRYISAFPEKADAEEARQKIETLKRIIGGQSEREAELSVILEEDGFDAEQGREAALELARMYLYQYPEKNDQAYDYLSEIVEYRQQDQAAAAEAYYLIGEYYNKRTERSQAAEAYARAAVLGSGDDDLVARALLQAAKSAYAAGDIEGARSMVNKLEAEFPHTQWVQEAKQILKREERD